MSLLFSSIYKYLHNFIFFSFSSFYVTLAENREVPEVSGDIRAGGRQLLRVDTLRVPVFGSNTNKAGIPHFGQVLSGNEEQTMELLISNSGGA